MAKIVWTEIAIDDLNNIANYHSQYSDNFAFALINRLFNKPKILKEMPELGRVVPERDNQSIRELIEGNYRIIYFFDKEIDTVEIITIHHASQPFS
ncbi:type II toxin-antitoxin system RelE/ParE family toxin [Pedobacter rhodius]|uniref:Type II toxin-antitoxin system RelE/ParE family toxin n=1 Tax=Pedobacter rhodius TaxID=3004098 RepID=A0ABT4KS07_9SPHI|nr:type II toxin-antitoxin system RelE/ParE family toxin [Pedobacter sp. SJ11]MCZ4221704.1 type II toxin-antitoxin system RelE/ParE family toxin [Pedobacter sp. SJ11]